jgi:hypothetical protein
LYTFVTIITGAITINASNIYNNPTLISFIFKLLCCIVIPNVLFILLFHRTEEFRYIYNMTRRLIFKK